MSDLLYDDRHLPGPPYVRRNFSIDVLRGASIILVICGHSLRYFGEWTYSVPFVPPEQFVYASLFGVMVFFTISGFLICSKFINPYSTELNVNIRDFYVRRLGRIGPPLMVVVTASLLIGISEGKTYDASIMLKGLLGFVTLRIALLGDLPVVTGTLDPLWSLFYEEEFYIALPAICMMVSSRLRLQIFMWAVVAVSILAQQVGLDPRESIVCFGQIALGSLIAINLQRLRTDSSFAAAALRITGCFLIIFACLKLDIKTKFVPTLVSVASAAMLLSSTHQLRHMKAVRWLLAPLAAVGKLSYEIYLIHLPIMSSTQSTIHSMQQYGQACNLFAMTMLFASIYVTAWTFERIMSRPCNGLIRRKLMIQGSAKHGSAAI